MARIRTIKPEFGKDYDLYLAEQKSKAPLRTFFALLWTHADREGRFKWKPEEIKAETMPHDKFDCEKILNVLLEFGFIKKYEYDNKNFGVIVNFNTHQRINCREAQSLLPDPNTCTHVQTPASTCMHTGKGREGKGKEGEYSPVTEPSLGLSPTVFEIPLVSGKSHFITKGDITRYQQNFPGIDVMQELRKLLQWNLDHPTRRKTERGIKGHIGTWLSKAQDRGNVFPLNPQTPKVKTETDKKLDAEKQAELEKTFEAAHLKRLQEYQNAKKAK